jgi:hypothetical protein
MRRRRDWLIVGSVVAIGATLSGVVSAANGSSDRRPVQAWGFQARTSAPPVIPHIARAKTVVMRLQNTTATLIDNPPTGTSQGDELAVEGQLIKLNGTPAGQLQVHESITGLGANTGGRLQITFTALLAGGQISGIGGARLNRATPALAISGGTGAYLGAHGEVFIHNGPHRTRLTFLLLPR